MGPYASVARVMPSVDSMPTAAMEMPYRPRLSVSLLKTKSVAKPYASRMAAQMVITGMAVERMPRPTPLITTVAEPVWAASASFCVGL